MKHLTINDLKLTIYDEFASAYHIDFSVYIECGFSGRRVFEVQAFEFDELMIELKNLYDTLSGVVEFRHWCDEYIRISSTDRKTGHFIVHGKIGENALFLGCDEHTHLVFEFGIDQTELGEFINDLGKYVANAASSI